MWRRLETFQFLFLIICRRETHKFELRSKIHLINDNFVDTNHRKWDNQHFHKICQIV